MARAAVLAALAVLASASVANSALMLFGHRAAFNASFATLSTHAGRALTAEDPLWLVKAREAPPPPPNTILEIVATAVYLVRAIPEHFDAVAEYTPDLKFAPDLFRDNDNTYMVRTDNVRAFVLKGCEVEPSGRGRVFCACDHDALNELVQRNDVFWVYPGRSRRVRPLSRETRRLVLGNPSGYVPPSVYNGSGMVVTISDSGLDALHTAFYDAANPVQIGSFAPNAHKKVVGIRSPIADYAARLNAHGTAVAGIAVGFPRLTFYSGVAPDAKLCFIDLSTGDQFMTITSSLEAFIINSYDAAGSSVHSASWGGDAFPVPGAYDDLANRFDVLARTRRKMVQVVAAGNEGADQSILSPATAKNVLSVGAGFSRPSDVPLSPNAPDMFFNLSADFTSRGPTLDGRWAPLVFTFGFLVLAPRAFETGHTAFDHGDYAYTSGLLENSGTSFAAPGIAALAAILQQEFKRKNAGALPDASLVQATMFAHAERIVGIWDPNTGDIIPNAALAKSFGSVIMDFARATDVEGLVVSAATGYRACTVVTPLDADTRPWRIALAWNDMQVHPGVARTLVNNLDMYVYDAGTGELLATGRDSLNKFEFVEIARPASGVRIVVKARQDVLTVDSLTDNVQYASIHVRANAAASACASACISSDFLACTQGRRACDATNGTYFPTCVRTVCNGCTPTATACVVLNGVGFRPTVNSSDCTVSACDAGYVLQSNACVCTDGTAKLCSNGQLNFCSSGAFAACPLDANVAPSAAAFGRHTAKWVVWLCGLAVMALSVIG